MRFLLDTHAFLWWITDDPQLSAVARGIIGDSDNELFLSVASAWEVAIKAGLGRLSLPERPDRFVPDQLTKNNIRPLPIEMSHALHVARLPAIHGDPFDRLIIAQSMLEKIPIITGDSVIPRYRVKTVW
jgi:PIN domain nuclease of toxin-antitoxin system